MYCQCPLLEEIRMGQMSVVQTVLDYQVTGNCSRAPDFYIQGNVIEFLFLPVDVTVTTAKWQSNNKLVVMR